MITTHAPSTRWEKRLVSPTDTATDRPATSFGRRHAWIAVLVVGAALFLIEERTLVATQNPNLVPSAILLGASIVPLAFVAFVYGRRLPYGVPGIAVAASAFLGGVIGTIVAATLEFDVLRDLGGLPMLGVGLIEETSKLLVPLALLFWLRRHRTRADGLLIGVACGAGFAALETMGYAFTTLIKSGGDITDTVDVLLLRGFLSPAGHMAWTGIAAAALYAAAATRRRGRSCSSPARSSSPWSCTPSGTAWTRRSAPRSSPSPASASSPSPRTAPPAPQADPARRGPQAPPLERIGARRAVHTGACAVHIVRDVHGRAPVCTSATEAPPGWPRAAPPAQLSRLRALRSGRSSAQWPQLSGRRPSASPARRRRRGRSAAP